jgi:hypothetical protein
MSGIVYREFAPDLVEELVHTDPMKQFLATHSKFKLIQYVRKGIYYAQILNGEGNAATAHSGVSAEAAIQELLQKISKAEWYQ